ncbi:MAG: hypothetical protein KAR83_09315 [Thermodesulfovibrionales bacterium]|nr:hypothetical protein [Thermodesulfovibrionales bacterium]
MSPDKKDKKKTDDTKTVKSPPAKTSMHSLSKQTVQDPAGEQSAGRRRSQGRPDSRDGKGGGKRPGGPGGRDSRGGRGKRSGGGRGGPRGPVDTSEMKNPPVASLGDAISSEMVEELKKRGLLK